MPYLSLFAPVLFVVALAFLLKHFLASLALAGLLAVITWLAHQILMRHGGPRTRGAVLIFAVLVFSFVAPFVFLFNTLSNELATVEGLVGQLNQTGAPVPEPLISSALSTLGQSNLANALYMFLALLTLFTLYIEGPSVVRYVDHADEGVTPKYYAVVRRLFLLSIRFGIHHISESARRMESELLACLGQAKDAILRVPRIGSP